ncbi:MAG: ABC transporter ATP-binding protein [Bdellovibrionales bacterium]
MNSCIEIRGLNKIYGNGFQALKDIDLEIRQGEIFALLGPNGAGKTTLIGTVCGIVNPTSGTVTVRGFDIVKDYKKSRSAIGLVPQELTTDAFESVFNAVSFSRGLFGKPANPGFIEKILKDLSLWDKRSNRIMTLSGGMKRRLLIAKALSHEPSVLFLDEPTAGVDVELRKGMWEQVRALREAGVTIVLTTHYIQEAEEMADRIGVINKGELVAVEDKNTLMKKLGRKNLIVALSKPIQSLPHSLSPFQPTLQKEGSEISFQYDTEGSKLQVNDIMKVLLQEQLPLEDITTKQSSLEEIFMDLVHQ